MMQHIVFLVVRLELPTSRGGGGALQAGGDSIQGPDIHETSNNNKAMTTP